METWYISRFSNFKMTTLLCLTVTGVQVANFWEKNLKLFSYYKRMTKNPPPILRNFDNFPLMHFIRLHPQMYFFKNNAEYEPAR